MTVVIYGSCPGCGRHTGLAGVLCYSSDVALGGGRRSGDPGERVVACRCGSLARPTTSETIRPEPLVGVSRPYIASASGALRDALRELLRTARRRHLSAAEEEMGRAMLDEFEARQKSGHHG